MTPQEIAARLPELTGGPHDDDTITALAQITAEAVRALNHATFPRAALSEPGTVYRVLGELATAANRLPQLCSQLARWLAEENTAGRLAHDSGSLPDALYRVLARLDERHPVGRPARRRPGRCPAGHGRAVPARRRR